MEGFSVVCSGPPATDMTLFPHMADYSKKVAAIQKETRDERTHYSLKTFRPIERSSIRNDGKVASLFGGSRK